MLAALLLFYSLTGLGLAALIWMLWRNRRRSEADIWMGRHDHLLLGLLLLAALSLGSFTAYVLELFLLSGK